MMESRRTSGSDKTLQKVRQRFYWANCQADVRTGAGSALYALLAMDLEYDPRPDASVQLSGGSLCPAQPGSHHRRRRLGERMDMSIRYSNGAALGSRQKFRINLFQEICLLLNIRKTRTTALHPQSDGMVERMNRTINPHLSKVVSDHQRDWDQYLHLFLMAYRSAVPSQPVKLLLVL
ncbi:hypothetical protein JTB14_006381 [Gonioctena quinquepunctata]|nr:hypothetical protein JTB14_006381 [Gonioctena quinquepunctata]